MKRIKFKFSSLIFFIMVLVITILPGCTFRSDDNVKATNVSQQMSESGSELQNPSSTNQSSQISINEPKTDLAPLFEEVKNLKGQEALTFFESLPAKGLSDNDILDFFIDLPLSDANKDVAALFKNDKFETYMSTYPTGTSFGNYNWTNGSGTKIKGEFSKLDLTLPFTDYIPLKGDSIGNPNKIYRIGMAIHGFDQPWNVGLAEAAKWQANRHSNLELDVKDAQWDNDRMADIIDSFILQKVDGILIWPMVESETTIAPISRAIKAGIPVVSVDRMTGYEQTTSRVTGNFPANGAQNGMYLIWKLAQEGNLHTNVILLRKPLGSTADAIRTGHFLKVLSYFPEINILKSYHDPDNSAQALANMQQALKEFPSIDVVFSTGDHQAIAAYNATKRANRLNSRKDGKKVMFLSIDDSKTAITSVKNGLFEVNTPYTPFISDIGLRALIHIITKDAPMPHDIITPNIPMITKNGVTIFGFKTQTPDEWYKYAFGAVPHY